LVRRPGVAPLTLGRKKPSGFLLVAYTTQMDDFAKHLMVTKSEVGIYADETRRRMVFHYDYDRAPPNDYPNPHLQVGGHSEPLTEICERARIPARIVGQLDLPVGGHRFRPTVEDVIEFLIIETPADGHPGWRKAVDEHRAEWQEIQLKATVCRCDEWAAEALSDLNHDVKPPPTRRPRGR
jgi:hypothetical protein